ncbi:unnamed protein product, partial [Ectocarpus sp. 8 AP-2014]
LHHIPFDCCGYISNGYCSLSVRSCSLSKNKHTPITYIFADSTHTAPFQYATSCWAPKVVATLTGTASRILQTAKTLNQSVGRWSSKKCHIAKGALCVEPHDPCIVG